jgi:hypothetical protein
VFTPFELIERLLPLVPRPRKHTIRFNGILRARGRLQVDGRAGINDGGAAEEPACTGAARAVSAPGAVYQFRHPRVAPILLGCRPAGFTRCGRGVARRASRQQAAVAAACKRRNSDRRARLRRYFVDSVRSTESHIFW